MCSFFRRCNTHYTTLICISLGSDIALTISVKVSDYLLGLQVFQGEAFCHPAACTISLVLNASKAMHDP